MRLPLPRSLFARLMLIWLIGIALVLAVSLALFVGELGIGTNPLARLTGVILEDEKIYGSTHIAFGTNDDFGGVTKAISHIDCVTLVPEVYLDDVLVAKDGKLVR